VIPKKLHFIWMQGDTEMPANYRRCFDSWIPMHPEWDIKIWDLESLRELDLRNRWILNHDNPTVQSEVLRFEVVRLYGGIYLDADMECLRPLDGLVHSRDAFVSRRNSRSLENNGFGASVDNPWIVSMVDQIKSEQSRLTAPLGIDATLQRATEKHPEVEVLPHYLLHYMDTERDRIEWGDKALAVHHRFGLWLKTEAEDV